MTIKKSLDDVKIEFNPVFTDKQILHMLEVDSLDHHEHIAWTFVPVIEGHAAGEWFETFEEARLYSEHRHISMIAIFYWSKCVNAFRKEVGRDWSLFTYEERLNYGTL